MVITVDEWLKTRTEYLASNGITTPRLDALIILEDLLHKEKANLLAHLEMPIDSSTLSKLDDIIERRKKHEPIAYIRQVCEFYGRPFYVNSNVLVPRPESEVMISLFKDIVSNFNRPLVADIGTGSGCLGITAKLEAMNIRMILIDQSVEALRVAKINADKFAVSLEIVKSDLLSTVRKNQKLNILLCNLPYVPYDYPVNLDAKFEPRKAIFAKNNGLELYEKLYNQVSQSEYKPEYIITESLDFQHKELVLLASKAGYKMLKNLGLAQLFIYQKT